MPDISKNAGQSAKSTMSYDEALKKLETIVEAMEAGDLPLENLIAQFEEGTRLVKICQGKLEEAEVKIKQLEKNASGEMTVKPWTGGAQQA